MLEEKYTDDTIHDYYDNHEIFPSYVQVSLGVSRTFEDVPHSLFFPIVKPLIIDNDTQCDYCELRTFNFDPTLAPEGKTVLITMYPTRNYSYWVDLRASDKEKYKAEKERIAHDIIEILERKFGNIKEHVEVVDVSTPATVIRYTNNWKTLPGLDNFYMAGQWVQPGGGLPTAILSGRDVAQIICKNDKKKFTAM